MTKRMKQVLLGVVALAALGLGGSALAQGGTTANRTLEPASAPDRDNVQSGDQTTPDPPAKSSSLSTASKAKAASSDETPSAESAPNSDGPSGHADEPAGANSSIAGAPETNGESSRSEAPNNDGPGGHADEAGKPGADHQFDGQE